MDASLARTLRRAAFRLFLGTFFLLFASMYAMENYYTRHLPEAPNEATGQVHPVRLRYSSDRYGTESQARWIGRKTGVLGMAGICLVLMVGLKVNYPDDFPRR